MNNLVPIWDHQVYGNSLHPSNPMKEKYNLFCNHANYNVAKEFFHINPLCYKAPSFTYLNDMENARSNELLGDAQRAQLPVTCCMVKYYDQMGQAHLEYSNSMLVHDNFNAHITATGETILQALQQVAVVERLTSANRSVLGIQLMELLPNLMEVNVVDLHSPITKHGQLLLGKNYKRLSITHANGEFTSLNIPKEHLGWISYCWITVCTLLLALAFERV